MAKNKSQNSQKNAYLKELSQIKDFDVDHAKRCKINMSYFCTQNNAGQNFSELSELQRVQLFDKFKEITNKSLEEWKKEPGGEFYKDYNNFPPRCNTDYTHPSHVPSEVRWARFRLTGVYRLVGFVVDGKLHNTPSSDDAYHFDKNTFYIVFLDLKHRFWISEKK